jgi:single-stranded DNA-binding protein
MATRGVNKVMLLGHLSNDAQRKTTTGGTEYAQFIVMVNRSLRNGKMETGRILCEHWQMGVFDYLKQGRQVHIEGALKTLEVKQPDNSNRTIMWVAVDELILTDKKPENGTGREPGDDTAQIELEKIQGYTEQLQTRNLELTNELAALKCEGGALRSLEEQNQALRMQLEANQTEVRALRTQALEMQDAYRQKVIGPAKKTPAKKTPAKKTPAKKGVKG